MSARNRRNEAWDLVAKAVCAGDDVDGPAHEACYARAEMLLGDLERMGAARFPEPDPDDLIRATHLTVRINADCAAHLAAMLAEGVSATEVVRQGIALHKFGREGGITRLVVEGAEWKARARDLEAENARLRALLAEDVALLEELDAAWGGAGGAGS